MKPQDFIFRETFNAFQKLGYSLDDSEKVGRHAVDLWKKDHTAVNAKEKAILEGKKKFKTV